MGIMWGSCRLRSGVGVLGGVEQGLCMCVVIRIRLRHVLYKHEGGAGAKASD